MSILDGPAFPHPVNKHSCGFQYKIVDGMPARAYAAIHLCVPESGDAGLDAMIRKAQRVWVARAVVATMIHMSTTGDGGWDISTVVAGACNLADAMIAELEKKP